MTLDEGINHEELNHLPDDVIVIGYIIHRHVCNLAQIGNLAQIAVIFIG